MAINYCFNYKNLLCTKIRVLTKARGGKGMLQNPLKVKILATIKFQESELLFQVVVRINLATTKSM